MITGVIFYMKRLRIIFLFSIIISVTALGLFNRFTLQEPTQNTEYLRIHIRADDNSDRAQSVKFAVRDAIVEYLTPVVANCPTRALAEREVENRLIELSFVADTTLKKHGFYYGAAASVEREFFPTRVYGEYTLPAGEYTALILRLGRGEGDNWWCVVYPPLCFTGGTEIRYQSKIAEIIKNWKGN